MIIKCLAGEALPVYGKGDNIRDWLFVDDHVKALQAVFERGETGRSYMIGGRSERTNLQVVQTICTMLDRLQPRPDSKSYHDQISFVTDRPGHDFRYAIDASSLESELGWKPLENFESGIERTVRWYLDNRTWWEEILSGEYRGERLGTKLAEQRN
jgi:dTDP-glucose 4,6-dehydratase